ncbi:hypothetical protein LWC05_05415 [Acetobacter sicerae]|uniref:Uncharacterized protein n=1 Tax=Acetobacter sicerae TaxID=85325 RepID=A0ABS8VW64_9PROT|nr:hypothetical protein [Acetobacter sicerae]MCE0743329.1 hypothetical protein [Acetobacter sicerae]
MENCAFCYQNHILDGALTASSQVAALPVTNLKNQQGASSLGWRSLTTTPVSSANFIIKMTSAVVWRAFSLHRTNIGSSAIWRMQVTNGDDTVLDVIRPCNAANGQCLFVNPSDVLGDAVQITVWPNDTSQTWVDLPLAFAGPLWQPARNYGSESTADRVLGQDSVTSLGGSEFVESRWYQRKLSISHQSLGDTDSGVMDQILRIAATGQNILFIPDPSADPTVLAEKALFGRLSGGDLSNPFGNADRHALTLDLTERL